MTILCICMLKKQNVALSTSFRVDIKAILLPSNLKIMKSSTTEGPVLKESTVSLKRLNEKHRYFCLEWSSFVFRLPWFLQLLEALNLRLLQFASAGPSANHKVLWIGNASFEAGKSLETSYKTGQLQEGFKYSQLRPFSWQQNRTNYH